MREKKLVAILVAACLTAGFAETAFAQPAGQDEGERKGRLVKIEYYSADYKTGELVLKEMDKIEYDTKGNPSRLLLKLGPSGEIVSRVNYVGSTGNGSSSSRIETVVCDEKGRPVEAQLQLQSGLEQYDVIQKTAYFYNEEGKYSGKQEKIEARGTEEETTMEYNESGWKSVLRSPKISEWVWEYLYDGNGSYICVKSIVNGKTDIDVIDIQYDEAGRFSRYMTKSSYREFTYDYKAFTYDAQGRLIGGEEGIMDAVTGACTGGMRYHYTYDTYGNLTEVIREDRDGNIDRKTVFSYDYNAGTPAPEAIKTLRCYPKLDDLVSMVRSWFY